MTKYLILSALSISLLGACDSSLKQAPSQMSQQSVVWIIQQKERAALEKNGVTDYLDFLRQDNFNDADWFAFIKRVKKSPKLQKAIIFALVNCVEVTVTSEFYIYDRSVSINAFATDDEIIKFLTGN